MKSREAKDKSDATKAVSDRPEKRSVAREKEKTNVQFT